MSVGDVNSTARGSGARFNDGKPDLSLVPVRFIAQSYATPSKGLTFAERAALLAMEELGYFQERRSGRAANPLLAAIEFLDHDGEAWAECARVFTYGAQKYAPFNWAKGMAWSIPIACAARHLLAILKGEEIDPESGLPHRGHAMCNLVMLLTYLEGYPEGDDRMPATVFNPPAPAAAPGLVPNPAVSDHARSNCELGTKCPVCYLNPELA